MAKVLRRLKINEVSSVDRGAGEGCKVVLFKRDDTRDLFAKIFGAPSRRPERLRYLDRYRNDALPSLKQRNAYVTSDEAQERAYRRELFNDPEMGEAAEPAPNIKDEFDDEDEQPYDDDITKQHEISVIADLLCEAGAAEGAGLDRATALNFLLRDPRGVVLWRRLHKARAQKQQGENSMSKTDNWSAIAKQSGGLAAICEHVIAKGETSISEHELTKLISDNVPRRDGESAAQAFSRVFTANDETGLQLRKAVAIAKGAVGARLG